MTEVKENTSNQEKQDKLNKMYKNKTVYIPRKIAREQIKDKISSVFDLVGNVSFRLSFGLNSVFEEKIPKIMEKVFERKAYARRELPKKIHSIFMFVNSASANFLNSFETAAEAQAKIVYKLRKRKKFARKELVDMLKGSVSLLFDSHTRMSETWSYSVVPDFRWRLEKNLEYALENAEKSINRFKEEQWEKKEKQEMRVNNFLEKKETVHNFFGSVKENLAESTVTAISKLQGKLSLLLAESIKKNILEAPVPKKVTGEAHRTVSPSATNQQSIMPMGSNIATKNSINTISPTIQNDTVTYDVREDSPEYYKPYPPEPKRIKANKALSTNVPKNVTEIEIQAGNGQILEKHLKAKKEIKPSDPAAIDKPTQQTQFQKYDSIRDIEYKSSPQKRPNHSLQREIPHLPNLEDLENSKVAERLREKERNLRLGFERNLSEAISKQIERRGHEFVSARPSGKKERIEDEEQQAVKYYFEFKRRIKQKVNFHEISKDYSNEKSSQLITDGSLPPISGHQRDFSSDEYRSYRQPKKRMLNGSPLTNRPQPYSTRKKSNPSADYQIENPSDQSQLLSNISFQRTPEYPNGSTKKKYHINSPTPIKSNGIEFEFYTPPKIVTHDAKNPGYPTYSDKKSKFEAEIPRYFNKPLNYSPFEAVPRKPFVPKREDYLPRKHVSKWKVNYQGQVIGYNDVVKQSEAKAKYDKKLKDEMAMWAV